MTHPDRRTAPSAADIRDLYAMWQMGELRAEGLEAVAWGILGDPDYAEHKRDLTPEEREYMARDAYQCDPAYPYSEGIVLGDRDLCQWWLNAMADYVNDLF